MEEGLWAVPKEGAKERAVERYFSPFLTSVFARSGSDFSLPRSQNYTDDTLRPVTLKQLVDSEEAYPGADMSVDGSSITQVTVVGQVRAVNPQPTNITYRLDDGTATLDVRKWVDEKAVDPEPQFAPDQHVRVWGRLKVLNGRKHIGAHFLRAVDDFNEVNYHLLEATYVHLCLTRGMPGQQGGGGGGGTTGGGGGGGGGGDGMFVDSYGSGGDTSDNLKTRVSRCSPNARKMYEFMMNAPGANEGVHLQMVTSRTGLSVRDIKQASEELLGQGLIYTTADDETWAILDY